MLHGSSSKTLFNITQIKAWKNNLKHAVKWSDDEPWQNKMRAKKTGGPFHPTVN